MLTGKITLEKIICTWALKKIHFVEDKNSILASDRGEREREDEISLGN